MRSIALANQKGGVGKTTSTANLGASLALLGKKVLLIDIDPQANLSVHFGLNIFDEERSLYEVMVDRAKAADVIRPTEIEHLDLIPSNINLAGAEIELVGVVGRETVLRDALKGSVKRYDYVLIDCPPSLGLLTLNAMTTANEIFIPLQTEFFALQGMSKLLETVEIIQRRINPELSVTGIIACMFDRRTNLAHEVLDNIREYFADRLFSTVIRRNVKLAESPSHGSPIAKYAKSARGYKDYMALAEEVLAQEEKMKRRR
jgi:chromosome partitioning protein